MSGDLTRRTFLKQAAALAAGAASLGTLARALAQTTAKKAEPQPLTRQTAQRKLELAPQLKFDAPSYEPHIMPVRILKEWRPNDPRFLTHQVNYLGNFRRGSYFVVTLRNEGEGAAFDAVAEIFALIAALDRRGVFHSVIKFQRVAQMIGDVHPNSTSDFVTRIDWSGEEPFELPEPVRRRGGIEAYERLYVARYWHPVFDHAPSSYVPNERHFYRVMGGGVTRLR